MSVINWDACLDPILRNEAWALTDAACGPDSVFQEMMGSHMVLHMLTKAAGLCWVQSQEEDTKHLFTYLGDLQPDISHEWKHIAPILLPCLPFPPSALTFLTAYCGLLPTPALTSQDW